MADRSRDYELDPEAGTWKNVSLVAADDEVGGNGPWETYHILKAEDITEELLPAAMDRDKLYLTEYENVGSARAKPAARQDFVDAWNEGRLIVHYIGHGSPLGLADEALFQFDDVGALRNGAKLPVFLALSCDVAIFDDPTQKSMTEALVMQPGGGAVAGIAATYITFVGSNNALTNAFYGRLYPSAPGSLEPRDTLGRSAALGTALLGAKIIGTAGKTGRQVNDAKYVILGDPALRLQSGEEDVALQGDATTRLLTGQKELLRGAVAGSGSGTWYVRASESGILVDYPRPFDSYPKPKDEYEPARSDTIHYVLPGSAFFDGVGDFAASAADVEFRTPAVMRLGEYGRVRMLMESGTDLSVAAAAPLPVRAGALDTNDKTGPTIEFQDFAPGQVFRPGAELVAAIEDSSGVNVLGSVGANSILAEYDRAGVSVDLTDRFVLDSSSYTRGTVRLNLPDGLSSGSHTLSLSAADMAGNVGIVEIEFQLVESGETGIGRHAPFPNPFSNATNFVVEIEGAQPGDVALELDIYTVAGARVQSLETSLGGSGRVSLPWDGRDRRGDELANGTYLYVIRAHFGGPQPFTETATGRVVLMR
jgi:hypothetical protein